MENTFDRDVVNHVNQNKGFPSPFKTKLEAIKAAANWMLAISERNVTNL